MASQCRFSTRTVERWRRDVVMVVEGKEGRDWVDLPELTYGPCQSGAARIRERSRSSRCAEPAPPRSQHGVLPLHQGQSRCRRQMTTVLLRPKICHLDRCYLCRDQNRLPDRKVWDPSGGTERLTEICSKGTRGHGGKIRERDWGWECSNRGKQKAPLPVGSRAAGNPSVLRAKSV